MGRSEKSRSSETSNDPREIGKLARDYAQNRSLGFVVFLVIFLVLSLMFSGFSCLAAVSYRDGQWLLFGACMAMLAVAMAATIYISVPRWGSKLQERIVGRLYAKEGSVQLGPPPTRRRKWIGGLLGAVFAVYVATTVMLGALGVIPFSEQYMQPVSAIGFVPFVVGLWLLMRPASSPIMLLWPALYGLHAILIVAGVPILFVERPWDSLNMLIPTIGYGLLTGLISHAYSRFVLRRLRRSAGCGLRDETTEEPQP